MNRYKNLISRIVNKQEKMLTESKIGTIFNEGWSSSLARHYANIAPQSVKFERQRQNAIQSEIGNIVDYKMSTLNGHPCIIVSSIKSSSAYGDKFHVWPMTVFASKGHTFESSYQSKTFKVYLISRLSGNNAEKLAKRAFAEEYGEEWSFRTVAERSETFTREELENAGVEFDQEDDDNKWKEYERKATDITDNSEWALANRKEIEERRAWTWLKSIYKDNWTFEVGDPEEDRFGRRNKKFVYTVGTVTDANGTSLKGGEYALSIPQTITIFCPYDLPQVLPDIITNNIQEEVNDMLRRYGRYDLRPYEWRPKNNPKYKQNYSSKLPETVKLPITISNIHK